MNMKIIIILILFVLSTSLANIFLKIGVSGKEFKASEFMHIIFSWRVILGICLFAIALLLWLVILRLLPLSIAQSFSAAQFISVIIASRIILLEPIATGQWLGMALIALGIIVVSTSS